MEEGEEGLREYEELPLSLSQSMADQHCSTFQEQDINEAAEESSQLSRPPAQSSEFELESHSLKEYDPQEIEKYI